MGVVVDGITFLLLSARKTEHLELRLFVEPFVRKSLPNFTRVSFALFFALAFAACAKTNESTTDTTSITTTSSTPAAQEPAPANTNPPPPAPTTSSPATGWVVTAQGIANLRVGMTVAEAQAAYPTFKAAPSHDGGSCTYATLDGWPAGIGVMLDAGKVVRVEVRRGNFATSTGARIGDTEERIKSLYPGQITVSPHKYTDGHYLTVTPTAETDSANRIIFETDGRNVVNYRAGVRPQVEYVEGCS
jgi:hypothetical protein